MMNLLFDTHAFIWWTNDVEKLPPRVYELIMAADNELYLSLASIWEIQIKIQIGKMQFSRPLEEILELQQVNNGLRLIPMTAPHIFALKELPAIHRDPFDRILVAQARYEKFTLITKDPTIQQYDVRYLWD